MKKISDYGFRFKGHMSDSMESLPIGGGETGANVWLDGGGTLHLLVSRTDCWSELGRLLKTAHITVDAGFSADAEFELDIENGVLYITSDAGRYIVYAEDGAPCIRLKAELSAPAAPSVKLENYRFEPIYPTDSSNCATLAEIYESADVILPVSHGGAAQIHRNAESCYEFMLKRQEMDFWIGRQRDPLLGWSFGAAVYSPELSFDGKALVSGEKISSFTLTICSAAGFADSASDMASRLDSIYSARGGWSEDALEASKASWRRFWERSYILISGSDEAESVTRAILYQRYMVRCADRGAMPIKFNGSIFVAKQTEGRPGNYDCRNWGGPYWIQNTRLIYWHMLKMGDYYGMTPLIDMYLSMMPMSSEHVKRHYGHGGIHIWETATFFGLARDVDYGDHSESGEARLGEMKNRYIRYHYEGMLELSYMMLKYLAVTGDSSRRDGIFSFCLETLRFFDCHFSTLDGKLLLCPVSAVETWQYCADDMPDISGLTAVCRYIGEMKDVPAALRDYAAYMEKKIPDLPSDGKKLLPCRVKIETVNKNVENAELYPVFPFDLCGIGKPGLDLAVRAYDERLFRHDGGWSQDPIDAAMLGLESEAVRHLVRESAMTDRSALFPAMWGPNFDETPDQDHGSVICITAASMLLQGENVFPCWPKDWDVEFRLPTETGKTVRGAQRAGVREYEII